MGMIWVGAPQVSYVNEIVELVRMFYPEQQAAAIPNRNAEFGKAMSIRVYQKMTYYWKPDIQQKIRLH